MWYLSLTFLIRDLSVLDKIRNIGPSTLLPLSRFSRVRLCATPWTAAHQAPPSLGFSRQEHWSGLPLPSPMHESEKWKWSRSVVSDSQRPHGLQPTRLLRPWDFPGKSTGVGCHCLLQLFCLSTRLAWELNNKDNTNLGDLGKYFTAAFTRVSSSHNLKIIHQGTSLMVQGVKKPPNQCRGCGFSPWLGN